MMRLIIIMFCIFFPMMLDAQDSCSYCEGDTPPTLTASCTGGAGTVTYKWISPSLVETNSAAVSAGEAGIWTWECEDENGCTATGTYEIEIILEPVVTINADDICINTGQEISATGVPGGFTYSWNFGNNSDPATGEAATANVSWSTTGSKTITLLISNGTCDFQFETQITVTELTGSASCGNDD